MAEPDYRRSFEPEDFRGYFTWTRKLTLNLGGNLYHACHEERLYQILNDGELKLRSEWSLNLPNHGNWSAPRTWVGLNYFHNGNYYVPFLLTFSLNVLIDRHFMVFRRESGERKRYFFVQYEARIPVYSFGKTIWRNVNPTTYFQTSDEDLFMKPGAIYDIVVTQPLSLKDVSIGAVDHPNCISGECRGMNRNQGKRILVSIAKNEIHYWLSENAEDRALFRRFEVLDGTRIKLFDPENND